MAQKLSNLTVGAKIKLGKHQVGTETAQPIIWVVADKNHSGYPSDSVTLITLNSIDLRAYDAREGDSYVTGNPNYSLSNINQWLNSSAGAGAWYSAMHATDVSPTSTTTYYNTAYQSRTGFLYNFTEYESLCLLPTTLTLQTGADVSSKVTTKVILPSEWEILGTGEVSDGSSRLTYFKSNPVISYLTNQALTYTSSTSKPGSLTEPWQYWTRSTTATQVKCIAGTGAIVKWEANNGATAVRPMVNLSASCKISNSTDSDGCYTLVVNNLPTISGSNANLGTKSAGFSHTYSVTDGDSEAVTVTEYIDNAKVRTYTVTLGATNTFAVTNTTWLKLANGTHTLTITATDGYDTVTRTITFTKSVNKFTVQRSTPIAASTQPKQIIVTLVKNIPYNALLKVEVCNNGFDTSPTWETLEASSISSGLAHTFANETKSADKWGVNIRVTVDRNGGEGACYISEIGGNFE